MKNRARIAANYFRRQALLSGGPIEITLESTAKCNLYCPMCPRHIYTFDDESMDLDLFRDIVSDCKDHVEFVWPYGIGEPMIHSDIYKMIEVARSEGIRTGLSTNATLLDDKRGDMLLDSGLDYLILAFDGATKESYEKYSAKCDKKHQEFEKTKEGWAKQWGYKTWEEYQNSEEYQKRIKTE